MNKTEFRYDKDGHLIAYRDGKPVGRIYDMGELIEKGQEDKKNANGIKKTPCPVCGHPDLEEFEFCPVCNWCNDINQKLHPDMSGAGNNMSLNQAKEAYKKGEKID